MFIDLINKIKQKRKKLQNPTLNNIEEKITEEDNNFEIIISNQNNIYKIEINDYISIDNYIKKINSSEEYKILDLICNSVLYNNRKQKVNKGTYYVITLSNRIYNILFTDERILIDERIKIELDEQTQKENITQEKFIALHTNEYHYYSAKHDKTGNTFYTRYYDKNSLYNSETLDLSEEETYEEINSFVNNLESIEEIDKIIDIELLKINVLEELNKTIHQINRKLH